MLQGETIAAIATAPGRGGVAVVRVSGPEAFDIARKLTGRTWGARETREVGFARIRPPVSPVAPVPPVIDETVVLAFRGPHSYTGEDVVEFQCHGGQVTPRRVLSACLAAGARLARRGEFTERAFLNGRLDYDQAESVLDLIDAKTARAADAALEGLSGRKRRELKALYDQTLELSSTVEHALDVDEGELSSDFLPSVNASLVTLRSSLREAIARANEGRLLRDGALVVLAGPPNAGKSSLMNALLEENRAIVSDVPGTTRDSIEAWLDLDGWPVRLVDTAGLRETEDEIEVEGVRRAEELIAQADVVVMFPTPQPRNSAQGTRHKAHTCNLVAIHPKCDLGRGPGLNVSAKTGEGLEDLKRAIVAKFEERVSSADADGDVSVERLAALREVLAFLPPPSSLIPPPSFDLVLLGNALRQAAERLGGLIGATYSSDLLDNLFSRFCVGK